MKFYYHPRVRIVMQRDFKVYMYEDSLDGLRNTEFDVEKIQFTNLLILKKELTHVGLLKKCANDLATLSGD
jgi:hypothetical protein